MKKILVALMLVTVTFLIGCGSANSTTTDGITKDDFEKFRAEVRDEINGLNGRLSALEKKSVGKSGNVSKSDIDRLAAEFRDEMDALGIRVTELEKSGGKR